ncbi:FAD-dependent oxidoreductase [Falsochrobactrum shanghaiense]|uniref:FAD-dependent oxidoreductase n=1 Tax=Falsochrobactrum shanghaiense TaxID=2201899 RepID=A0A316JG20_9HYPH|nr:FAD-binding oxidoreductase [Falsochrobactrum shanghaiense]PWL19579.1 FAD-dependent oxidoreductase [Falsochrobactrum shanghaiense]
MTRIRILPADDNTNGWSHILPQRTPKPALSAHIKADWVVIGAGYAGLAAARRLAENRPGDHIVLLDAQQAGEGTSGRNAGFAIDLPHNVTASLEELAKSHGYRKLARAGIDYLRQQVDRHAIACQWSRQGKFHAAVTDLGIREVLEPTIKEMERLEEPFDWYESDELARRLGTSHYKAAIYTYGTILLNPAALVRGLADSLPENVTLYENTPAINVDYGKRIVVTTDRGSVEAPTMILTVNSFGEQFGFFKRKLLNFAAHASLSRPLTDEEYRALGEVEPWGVTPANSFSGITMRLTPDRRILVRQNVHFCPSLRQSDERRLAIKREHKRFFDERFPMLPQVEMQSTWTGYICLSRNGAPGFGRLAKNVYTSLCQNGVGIAKGTIGGMLAADMACNIDNPLIADMYSLGSPVRLPPRPFLDIGVRSRFAWEMWRARREV